MRFISNIFKTNQYGSTENISSNPQKTPLQKGISQRLNGHHLRQKYSNCHCQRVQVPFSPFRQKVDLTKYIEETAFNFDFAFH